MPTRWDGKGIVVADAVTISPPYRVDDCRPLVAGDKAALGRVRKVVRSSFSTTHHHYGSLFTCLRTNPSCQTK